jgi:hypothetical protein
MLVTLKPHPDSPGPAIEIAVEVLRPRTPAVALRYVVSGEVSRVVLPEAVRPSRADELWRTTCFEAFIETTGGGYCELNLSPTGRWAAYEFTGYRAGMQSHAGVEKRDSARVRDETGFSLAGTFDLDRLIGDAPRPWRMGLSAVIEDVDGGISYWALTHPPGKPDFHHPDSFALTLPTPEPA